ncbi:MAG: sensor histidine kinase [Granulosicoccus sp.]
MIRQSALTVLLQNFLFCTFIALILWQAVPSLGQYGLFANFVHAQAIGNFVAIPAIIASRLANSFGLSSRSLFIILAAITPIGIYAGLGLAGWWLEDISGTDKYNLLGNPEQFLIAAGAAVIASTAFYWHWSSREKVLKLELIASEESRRADIARHVMLQAQLEPHMLFNTLANLRALIGSDTERAIEMLDRLDSFLRETLSSTQAATHSLEHEFKVLEDYLALMQIRLGKCLSYELHLPAECRDLVIPSLLLQPLVENAIRHGIEPQIDGGIIVASASCSADHLQLIVADTGVGMKESLVTQSSDHTALMRLSKRKNKQDGFGLNHLRERLAQTYGNGVELRFESGLTDSSLKGTRVTLRIPLTVTDQSEMQSDSAKKTTLMKLAQERPLQ